MTRMRAARIVVYVLAVPVVVLAAVFVARVFVTDPAAAPAEAVRAYIGDIGGRRFDEAYGRLCEKRQAAAGISEFESIVTAPLLDHGGLDDVEVRNVEIPEADGGKVAVVKYRVSWNDGTIWNDEVRLERVRGNWRLCEFRN